MVVHIYGPYGPVILTGVLCVRSLHINLCSGPKFTSKGGEYWQGGDKCKLQRDGQTLLKGSRLATCTNHHALPKARSDDFSSYMNASSALWHRVLGHPGSKIISQMVKAQAVRGLEKITLCADEKSCTTCSSAKHTRASYPLSTETASKTAYVAHPQ
jgi:hypothetical protein